MKVTTARDCKEFTPIDVKITIESQEELDSLIARLSISPTDVNNALTATNYPVKERAYSLATSILLQKLELLKG